jgi:hypothetical protein
VRRPETKIPKGVVVGENRKLVVSTGRKETVEKVGELLERRFAAYVRERRERREEGEGRGQRDQRRPKGERREEEGEEEEERPEGQEEIKWSKSLQVYHQKN